MKIQKVKKQTGFTIVELMIATVVFSMVTLLITTAVLRVSSTYLRGVATAATQETARNVMNDISQSIQFSAGSVIPTPPPGAGSQFFCVDSTRYSYQLNTELVNGTPSTHQGNHVLVRDGLASVCTAATGAQPLGGGAVAGNELLGAHMRLAELKVTQLGSSNLYQINVRIVYGDDDVLDSTQTSCANNASLGIQFCALADLSTIVERRI